MSDSTEDRLDELARAPAPVPKPLSAALEAELGKLEAVAPRRPLRQLAILAGISLVYGAALLVAFTVRRDMRELPTMWLTGAAIAWFAGFAIPCYLALVPPRGSMMPRWRLAAISALVASLAFVILGLAIHPIGASSVQYGWHDFVRGHVCLEIGLASALVPVVIGAIFLRGAMPVGSRWIAAALGAGGGCLGGLVLHWHCHVADGLHIGLVHGGVVVIAAVLSAIVVPRATDKPLK